VERSFVSSSSFVISDDAANALENSKKCFRNQNEAVRRHKFLALKFFAERKRESVSSPLSFSLFPSRLRACIFN
jgi:hypothetical protein